MSSTTMPCAAGVAATTLAAWRDGALGDSEAERLREHIAGCAACQAQLDAADRADAAIRAQSVPAPDARLWRGVRDGIAHPREHARRTSGARPGRRPTTRAILGGIAAVAAIALITVGFARVFQLRHTTPITAHGGTPTVIPTVTAVPEQTHAIVGTPLAWQAATLPPGVSNDPTQGVLTLALAATDGNTAYACFAQATTNLPLQIWVTHDRAVRWTLAGQIPPVGLATDCVLQVDQGDAQRLIANVLGHTTTPSATLTLAYRSDDGGVTWQFVSNTAFQQELISVGATSFAIQSSSASAYSASGDSHLVISHDGRQTWLPIDFALQPHGEVTAFWVTPNGKALLAAVTDVRHVASTPTTLWQTTDVGAHWRQIATPSTSLENQFVVQSPVSGQPWHICAWNSQQGANNTIEMSLFCTSDGGAAWVARPGLLISEVQCTNCGTGVSAPTGAPGIVGATIGGLWLTSDGSLLGYGDYGPVKNGIIQQVTGVGLYRLKAGASQWESLGPIPGGHFFYVGAPGSGVLGGLSGGSYGGGLPLSVDVGGPENSLRQLGTVTYP